MSTSLTHQGLCSPRPFNDLICSTRQIRHGRCRGNVSGQGDDVNEVTSIPLTDL